MLLVGNATLGGQIEQLRKCLLGIAICAAEPLGHLSQELLLDHIHCVGTVLVRADVLSHLREVRPLMAGQGKRVLLRKPVSQLSRSAEHIFS